MFNIKKWFSKSSKASDDQGGPIRRVVGGYQPTAGGMKSPPNGTSAIVSGLQGPTGVTGPVGFSIGSVPTSSITSFSAITGSTNFVGSFTASPHKIHLDIGAIKRSANPYGVLFHELSLSNGAKFDLDKPLFQSGFRLTNENDSWHLERWIDINADLVNDYGFIISPTMDVSLVFNSQESADAFNAWLDDYKARFFTQDNFYETRIPVTKQGKVSGYMVERSSITPLGADWSWIVSNCSGRASGLANHRWLFQNQADSMLYKMHSGI